MRRRRWREERQALITRPAADRHSRCKVTTPRSSPAPRADPAQLSAPPAARRDAHAQSSRWDVDVEGSTIGASQPNRLNGPCSRTTPAVRPPTHEFTPATLLQVVGSYSSSCTVSGCSAASSAADRFASCCPASVAAVASAASASSSAASSAAAPAAASVPPLPSAAASRSSVCRRARLRCTRHCSIVRSRQSAAASTLGRGGQDEQAAHAAPHCKARGLGAAHATAHTQQQSNTQMLSINNLAPLPVTVPPYSRAWSSASLVGRAASRAASRSYSAAVASSPLAAGAGRKACDRRGWSRPTSNQGCPCALWQGLGSD